jgi:hypothetical protein
MAAPEPFADMSDSSCNAGAVHTRHEAIVRGSATIPSAILGISDVSSACARVRPGLAETITGPLGDTRNPCRVRNSYAEMVTARMVMIAAGSQMSLRRGAHPGLPANASSRPLIYRGILTG